MESRKASSSSRCPFCQASPERIFHESRLVLGLWDGFPVSPGHALLVPRRHIPTWFKASGEEQQELTAALQVARDAILAAGHRPDGFNIGMNLDPAAGQTVGHLHIHVIPRYKGDVPDLRGGVRWVVPQRADYWSKR
jgi:diadenosine tetraphosphate (Ap4A) HIT family hydrolase